MEEDRTGVSSPPSMLCSSPVAERAGALNLKLGAVIMLASGAIYSFDIGRSLGASEAYSAMAATQPSFGAAIHAALRFDQCKPPLYQILLHAWALVFGGGDISLRALSLIFSMASVGLVMALGTSMFAPSVGVAAAVLWALCPLAIIYGAWARMYSMFIALALAQFLALWDLRRQPSAAKVVLCGLLGAATLYTHLGGVLLLGAEAAMLMRTPSRGERTSAAWLAIFLAAIVFVPFVPIAASQVSAYIYGHWVDWIGPAHPVSPARKAAVFFAAALFAGLLTLGPRLENDKREPLRWCVVVGLLPIGALVAGSFAIRPMFDIRYVAPAAAMLVLAIARLLALLPGRSFSLSVFGISCLLFFMLPYYPRYDPWRDMARQVSHGSPTEPVFFESGYVDSTVAETNPQRGFPQGFFRVPFDRYFEGPNPRVVIDPSAPRQARRAIAAAAEHNHGAWLVSGLKERRARAEMPTECFKIDKMAGSNYANLYQITPLAACSVSRESRVLQPAKPAAGF
jgi:hypothetical protein